MSKQIVFFGTDNFSATCLQALIDAGFDIGTVVTKPDSAKGRSKELTPSPVKVLAENANIAILQPEKVSEISTNIRKLEDAAGVLVSYGKLIPNEILSLFNPGIINLHPSLLPKYRGPSPIESAILGEDRETGVSIMQLTAEMDAGPIYSQVKIPLNNTEYASDLYGTLATKSAELLVDKLPDILSGQLQPSPQDDSQATYCQLIEKTDGNIDWNEPAPKIDRKIRAYNIWPKSRTKLGDTEVIITKAQEKGDSGEAGSVNILEDKLLVYCGEGSLEVQQIQPIGKKEMPIQAFLAGYKDRLTTR